MYGYLTNEEIKNLRKNSINNGWNPLPVNGANNRAYYRVCDNGNIQLKSYDTIVFEYVCETGELVRKWSGYSATTLKHVEMFVCWLGGTEYRKNTTFGKANWEKMYVG